MTAFTDEDLKALKEGIVEDERDQAIVRIANNVVYALIARLEAAEVCAKYLSELYLLDSEDENALAAWRKAAGKDKGDA